MKTLYIQGPGGSARVGPKSASGWTAMTAALEDRNPHLIEEVEAAMVEALMDGPEAVPEISAKPIAEARMRDAYWCGLIERISPDSIRLVRPGEVSMFDAFGGGTHGVPMSEATEIVETMVGIVTQEHWVKREDLVAQIAERTGWSRSLCGSALNFALKTKKLRQIGKNGDHPIIGLPSGRSVKAA